MLIKKIKNTILFNVFLNICFQYSLIFTGNKAGVTYNISLYETNINNKF